MKFYCSLCGQKIETGETPAGSALVCPGCGGAASVPLASPTGAELAPARPPERFRANPLIIFCVLAMLAFLLFLFLQPPHSGWCKAARGVIFGRHLTAAANNETRAMNNDAPGGSSASIPEAIASNAPATLPAGNVIPQPSPGVADSSSLTPAPANRFRTNSTAFPPAASTPAPSLTPSNQTAGSPAHRSNLPRAQSPTPMDAAPMAQPRRQRPPVEFPTSRTALTPTPAQGPARRAPFDPSAMQLNHEVAARTQATAPQTSARTSSNQSAHQLSPQEKDQAYAAQAKENAKKNGWLALSETEKQQAYADQQAMARPRDEQPDEQSSDLARTYALMRERQAAPGNKSIGLQTPVTQSADQPEQLAKPRSPVSDPLPTVTERSAQPPVIAQARSQVTGARRGSNFVYVIDRSDNMKTDNMGSSRLNAACQELIDALHSLPTGASVCVIFYDSNSESMPGTGYLPATSVNVARIVDWIKTQSPRGDPDPVTAMRRALNMKPDTIWLLSDGMFGSGVNETIRRSNPDQRVIINTIAFHDLRGQSTMEQIAEANSGDYRFVPPMANTPTPPAHAP